MVVVPDDGNLGNPMPPLDAATEAALRASIERFGVIVPVVKDQHGRILDGHHRARIAAELGVACPDAVREVEDDDQAREIAVTLNADRRQMTSEQRQEIVLALRQEGHSQRAIAAAVGASRATVRRDVEAQVGQGAHLPETTVGRDAKEYPARRPREPKPEPTLPRISLPAHWTPRLSDAVERARTALLSCDPRTLKALDAAIEKEPEPPQADPQERPSRSRFGRSSAPPARARGCTFDTPRGVKCKLCGKVH